MRYLDGGESQRLLSDTCKLAPGGSSPALSQSVILVQLEIEPFKAKQKRAAKQLLETIERYLLSPFAPEILVGEQEHYRIRIEHSTELMLEEKVEALLSDIHALARDRQCFLEARFRLENDGGKTWS